MTDILDLPDWTVTAKRLDGAEYELEAEFASQPAACLKCGVVGRLYKHGTKVTTYRDSPIRGHPVRLLARVQRYRCRECGETFLQPLEGIGEDRRMTVRCAEYIKEQCLRDTFVRIAEHVGCDDKTVRNLAGEYIASLDADYRPGLPPLPPPSGPKPTLLPPARRISPRERADLLDAAGGRCLSCSGVFDPSDLDIHQTLPLVPGEHRKTMVVCKRCHQRFHTGEINKHYRPSTQKSG